MVREILDLTDRKILDLIQRNFPLVSRPFQAIAARVSLRERVVIERLARLKRSGIVREICAIFEAQRLGYHSTLAAMAVEPEQIEAAAAVVNVHPGVSHNYERTHRFNLWFTLTVGRDRTIEREVERLARKAHADDFLVLLALRRFKIAVDLDLGTRDAIECEGDRPQAASQNPESRIQNAAPAFVALGDSEKAVVRALQHDLPLEPRPFGHLAAGISMRESQLLAVAQDFLDTGVMRRMGAIVHPRRVGYVGNAMVCWQVPPQRIEQAGTKAARQRAVSHCYERRAFPPRWPFNLMTMIHGQSEGRVQRIVERLLADIRPIAHAILFSRREFKKQRVYYFESI